MYARLFKCKIVNYFPAACLTLLAATKIRILKPRPIIKPITFEGVTVVPSGLFCTKNAIILITSNIKAISVNTHAGIILEISFDALTEQIP